MSEIAAREPSATFDSFVTSLESHGKFRVFSVLARC